MISFLTKALKKEVKLQIQVYMEFISGHYFCENDSAENVTSVQVLNRYSQQNISYFLKVIQMCFLEKTNHTTLKKNENYKFDV